MEMKLEKKKNSCKRMNKCWANHIFSSFSTSYIFFPRFFSFYSFSSTLYLCSSRTDFIFITLAPSSAANVLISYRLLAFHRFTFPVSCVRSPYAIFFPSFVLSLLVSFAFPFLILSFCCACQFPYFGLTSIWFTAVHNDILHFHSSRIFCSIPLHIQT